MIIIIIIIVIMIIIIIIIITFFTRTFTVFFFNQGNVKTKKKVYYMSLETEVTKGFLVSLQLLCFYEDLREKKLLRE